MLANNCEYNIFEHQAIKFIHYPQTRFDYDILASYYDVVVFGGGALIDDKEYNIQYGKEMSLATTLIELTERMLLNHKACYWLGLSTNDVLKQPLFISKMKWIVREITHFSLRDCYSLKSLKEAGIDTSRIKIVDDIALANPQLKPIPHKTKTTKQIGIILICNEDTHEQDIYNILNTIEKHKKKIGGDYTIHFIPFYDYVHNDVRRLTDFVNKYPLPNVQVEPYVNSFEEITNVINKQDYIISMRYHATLLSLFLGKKVWNIVYDKHRHYPNKMAYLYDHYQFPNNSTKQSELTETTIEEGINKLLNQKPHTTPKKVLEENRAYMETIIEQICQQNS